MMIWGVPMSWSTQLSNAWEGSFTATWDRLIRWASPPLISHFRSGCLHKSTQQLHTVLQIKGVLLSCYSSKPVESGALDTSGSSFISWQVTIGASCFSPEGLITGNLLIAKVFWFLRGNFTPRLPEICCMRVSWLWMKKTLFFVHWY